jgi:tRNA G18 (ribose-2'-O)-methylase SpoU
LNPGILNRSVIQIAHLDDPRVADYAHVGDPEWLRRRGFFVAEGRLVVRRLFEASSFRAQSVLVTPAALAAMQDLLDTERCPIYVCDQATLSDLTGFNFHRGCLAIGERPDAAEPLERLARARCLLALEGVGNPDNVGGLFRAAAALGSDAVLLDTSCADPLYRKSIRTSMGAVFRLPFAVVDDWVSTIRTLDRGDVDIVALTPNPSAMRLADIARNRAPKRRLILMLGAEGPGLSSEAMDIATVAARIPIAPDVDSLNVVVAAGIALAALELPAGAAG